MKAVKSLVLFPCIALGVALSFLSCSDKTFEKTTFTANVPVYMDFTTFRSEVKATAPMPLEKPGKIYLKNDLLFINELFKGVHVFNNADPTAPQYLTFINIPGNIDISVRNNVLFADSFIDLVAIDISDVTNPVEIDRLENVFPNTLPPYEPEYPVYGLDFTKGVVVGWQQKQITEINDFQNQFNGWVFFDGLGRPSLGGAQVSLPGATTGQGGSMARFAICDQHMFAAHNNSLILFDVANVPGMKREIKIDAQRQIETIFSLNDKLFLGTTTGMLVYDISQPAMPTFISEFSHINACDPVVVQDTLAFVTLRSGTLCQGFVNQLDVIGIGDISQPKLLKTYPMYNPHGLGIEGNLLFVCDGDAGLKVFDVSDPFNLTQNLIAQFQQIRTYDVIPRNGLLLLVGDDGLFQYDYSNPQQLVLLSHIPIQ